MEVFAATQCTTNTQTAIAQVLNIPLKKYGIQTQRVSFLAILAWDSSKSAERYDTPAHALWCLHHWR
jgi:hypothetical protein